MRKSMGRIVLPILVTFLVAGLLSSCGFRRQKYENPITRDTQQPDKILFDKAVNDVEKRRYSVARLTLQTLIGTYDTSEFLAKAKLLIADTWIREGGAGGLANAEAEYKDFILFYPMLEEAAEAQAKVCDIHYRQMDKPDRDVDEALKADEECRELLVQFPNSKFAPEIQQKIRNIQEVLAQHEFKVGSYYYGKGSFVAAANRLQGLTDQYPLFSKADEALLLLGDSYSRLNRPYSARAIDPFTRMLREYPLSAYAEDARRRLTSLEQPIPEPDPVALSRMKYELANQDKPGIMSHFWGAFRKSPDVSMAAKSGAPATSALRPTMPMSVPGQIPGGAVVGSDVTVSTVSGAGGPLDTQPDARQNPPATTPPPKPQ